MPDYSNLTSGQYAYLLLRQLQRDISCDWMGDRMAALAYFGAVFKDPTVVVTYPVYQRFSELMGEGMEYCAAKDLKSLDVIIDDKTAMDKFMSPIKAAFADIGCTVDDRNIYQGELIITAPGGTAYQIHGGRFSGSGHDERLRSRLRCTDAYWDEIRHTYGMGREPLLSIEDIEHRRCGENATWTVSGDVISISGTGAVLGGRKVALTGGHFCLFNMTNLAEAATTIVLGAGIDTLKAYSMDLADSMTLVCLRAADDPMTFEDAWTGVPPIADMKTSAMSMVIYTDNLALRSYSFPSKVTVTWHSLSEWEG